MLSCLFVGGSLPNDAFASQVVKMVTIGVAILVAIRIFFMWFNGPKKRGARGERRLAERLRRGLPPSYRILNDVYLPLRDGMTTQIDHIVVSPQGIFVIEIKTFSGWIFGDKDSQQWMQVRYQKKSPFQNPLRQNFRHICALAENLDMDQSQFQNVVVFAGNCEFKTEVPDGVVRTEHAAGYIRGFERPVFTPERVGEIVAAIERAAARVTGEQRANHAANLGRRHARV